MQALTKGHVSFLYEEIDGVARITFNRPERLNALTFEVYAELRDTFAELNHNPNVRAVLITGQGRGFCSGGDVEEIIGDLLKRGAKSVMEFARRAGALTRNICECQKPVVAALNGVTAGAGAAIALASDFRIAAEGIKMAFLFNRVGLTGADMGVAYVLPRGWCQGLRMISLFLGDLYKAERALEI